MNYLSRIVLAKRGNKWASRNLLMKKLADISKNTGVFYCPKPIKVPNTR